MVYANNGKYDNAISSFLSDVSKSECTDCISDNGFMSLIILREFSGDTVKFEKALKDFSISCKCKK